MSSSPEDRTAETEAVLSLQEVPTTEDQDDVQAHLSATSIFCDPRTATETEAF
ncbi:hypothetical protein [Kitasatospora sp. CB02891]|uniref:hypothetical protein n=1 Tax=Kitasatospora sp. CB02891 TaxID=2020329 RepID=UPI0012FE3C73|nr:hypothetical protein [Kitasatospora sp. CB02891]